MLVTIDSLGTVEGTVSVTAGVDRMPVVVKVPPFDIVMMIDSDWMLLVDSPPEFVPDVLSGEAVRDV